MHSRQVVAVNPHTEHGELQILEVHVKLGINVYPGKHPKHFRLLHVSHPGYVKLQITQLTKLN